MNGSQYEEYRVVATIEHDASDRAVNDTRPTEVTSDWLREKQRADALAGELAQMGHAEVEVRDRRAYVPGDDSDD